MEANFKKKITGDQLLVWQRKISQIFGYILIPTETRIEIRTEPTSANYAFSTLHTQTP